MVTARRYRDPDVALVAELLAPPPLEDARRSLEYWERRRRSLAFHRRRARREAAEMAARWEARVRLAERARLESTLPGMLLARLGLAGLWEWRARLRTRGVARLAWSLLPRQVKVVACGVVVAWLLVATGVLALFATALSHLA